MLSPRIPEPVEGSSKYKQLQDASTALSKPENTKQAYTRIAHAILGAKAIAGTGIQGANAFAQDP